MSVIFHPLRVRSIEPDTAEAVVVAFEVPADLREVFGFTQGQYLTLRTEIDGQDLRRSYSICAGVDDDELRVGVRKVRGGVFSNWINASLRVGDLLVSSSFPVAASRVAPRIPAWEFPKVAARCSKETASARNSPSESQRR